MFVAAVVVMVMKQEEGWAVLRPLNVSHSNVSDNNVKSGAGGISVNKA